MRFSIFRLYCNSVLGLICIDLAILISVLRKIYFRRVRDRDLITFPHGGKGIIKTVCRSVVRVVAAVAAHSDIIVEDEGITGNNVLYIDIRHIPGRIDFDGIVECTC